MLPDIRDMRACPEVGGAVEFPPGAAPYPFGVDPIWHGTKSELPFLNSMKMKMSIVLGVTHMNLGIVMSLYNNLYFKDRLSTICEFIPQVGRAAEVMGQRGRASLGKAGREGGPTTVPVRG